MTTKVIVLCPDHSVHDVHVMIEKQDEAGGWDAMRELVVPPTEQSEPIYIDKHTRLVVFEAASDREQATPHGGK